MFMKLCAGQYKYLLTVYELSKTLKVVRSVDIANSLSVTRPSVSRMLKCMARLELINPDYASSVVLTDLGRETAKKLSVNFDMIHKFFTEILKLDEHSAYEQSILFLSTFPENTTQKLAAITRNTIKKRNEQHK
ncbi:metal-dependent transcriptional regulator [Porcipelethomonas sp.]|uniref:metal-dependent transcriptional regulator n=1 Tax=Porcipelethomonas sp. TaxID=2981675 RepID=UPI003EF84E96